MRLKKCLILGTSLFMLISHTHVKAYTELQLKKNNNEYSKSVIGTLDEETEAIELLNHDIIVDSKLYNIAEITKTQNEDVKKEVSKQKIKTLKNNNQEYIKEYFGETYVYEDEEYKGEIPMTNIHINKIDYGEYQELREKRIEFSNYSKNDLDMIKKEITDNNLTYYLIKVDWNVENTEIIDNQEVPISYKGTMIYQTVVSLNYPYEYEITVTYSGEVSGKEKTYTYTAIYKEPEQPIVEESANNIVPTIIISGIGFGLATLLFLLLNKNAIIYNKSETGYKRLGKYKLSVKSKNEIDITKYNYKISSNMYCLKLKKRTYEKLKNRIVYVKIENIAKPVTITSMFIEFII